MLLHEEKFDLRAQVKTSLLEIIHTMSSTGKIQLPSEKRLADKLQVSRSTIRTVLATLEQEGRIFRRHGKGTYLNTHTVDIKSTLYPHVYYAELIKRNGYVPEIRVLAVEIGKNKEIAARLGLDAACDIVCVQKLYLADGNMCIYCKDFFYGQLFSSEQIESMKIEPVPIFHFFDKYNKMTASWSMLRLDVTDTNRNPELTDYSDKPMHGVKPFLCVESLTYNQHDQPMLFEHSFIDTGILNLYLIKNLVVEEFEKVL